MPYTNPSVAKFKFDMQDLVQKAKRNFHQELLSMADELMDNMRQVVPKGDTGHLSKSIRKKDVSNADGTKLSVLVMAGGPLTMRGNSDYAVHTEFGTVKEAAEPFFYSTYRIYKKGGPATFRETLQETIEENNIVRATRGQNYSNAGAVVSVAHRGAVVIHK